MLFPIKDVPATVTPIEDATITTNKLEMTYLMLLKLQVISCQHKMYQQYCIKFEITFLPLQVMRAYEPILEFSLSVNPN